MSKAKRQPRRKHIPLRTCIVCRETKPKRELARIVLQADGKVEVDDTGKLGGRGAYLCRQRSCWQTALKRGSLSRALRAKLSGDAFASLEAYAESLPETREME